MSKSRINGFVPVWGHSFVNYTSRLSHKRGRANNGKIGSVDLSKNING